MNETQHFFEYLMKEFEENANKIHADSYQLENPKGREQSILEEVKYNLKEELLKENSIAKEISYLLYRARQDGLKIKIEE